MPSKLTWTCFSLCMVGGVLAACQPAPRDEGKINRDVNEVVARPPLPAVEKPIDRGGLLLAIARAGSAAALGRKPVAEQPPLDGRPFEVRIRFGCPTGSDPKVAGAGDQAPFAVAFSPADRTLRIRARPDLTIKDTRVAAGQDIEAVEGFWIYRPWLLTDGCPPLPAKSPDSQPEVADTKTVEVPEQSQQPQLRARVGIAHFFTKDDPRTGRRDGRAYEATKVLSAEETPSPQGYNLVLAGRLVKRPGGEVISCRVLNLDLPPECIVAAQLDRVRIERPDTGVVLAEWSS